MKNTCLGTILLNFIREETVYAHFLEIFFSLTYLWSFPKRYSIDNHRDLKEKMKDVKSKTK